MARVPRQALRNYDTVDFKAGAIRYSGANYLAGAVVSRTWGMKPYIGFRWRGSGGGGGGGGGGQSQRTYRIWIENSTRNPVHYKLNGGKFSVSPGQTRWHSRSGNPTFNVEYDWSFVSGYQRKGYRLTPGSRNYFAKVGCLNGLELYKR